MKPEIIQQCQFLGPPHPAMLNDGLLEDCRKNGITSFQSYVTWAEIEKEQGKFDFSSYDSLVGKLKQHGLKWVPFLILGPEYSVPKWFRESKDSVFYKCLEHGIESKIQSIWNPALPKYVEKFIKNFSEHFKDENIFECVTFGISGNWGEAIYPADGGFNADFHSHPGFWAADNYARASFIEFMSKKYRSLSELNLAWQSDYRSYANMEFPSLRQEKGTAFINLAVGIAGKSPVFLKNILRLFRGFFARTGNKAFFLVSHSDFRPAAAAAANPGERRKWLDFADWYFFSMNNWAEFWLQTSRKYFPHNKIYLVTGGIGDIASGTNFSMQAKIAAKYQAGLRITNQTDDYSQSFILTRLGASAAKLYGSYFVTEEAAILQSGPGTVMRIFDAISSGAEGIYCKNFISTGNDDPCLKKILPAGVKTGGFAALSANLQYWQDDRPIIDNAVFFPNTTALFDDNVIIALFNRAALLRKNIDFDLVDENMIRDNGLEKYKSLLVLEGELPKGEISEKVEVWQKLGGNLVLGKAQDTKETAQDNVFVSRFPRRILCYNPNNKKVEKNINFLNKKIEIGPNSILSISI